MRKAIFVGLMLLGLVTVILLTSACVPATPAPQVGPAETPFPEFAQMDIREWSATSPDGEWIAQGMVAFPKAGGDNYYTQLTVARTDGAVEWAVVDEWSEWGLGYITPQLLHWSQDGRYFYFTNRPVPDGCGVFVNGSDLHKVDLSDGSVTQVVPPSGLWLSLSPDETRLAYIGFGDRGLVVRNLSTGSERIVKLKPGKDYTAGHIVWSPDGTSLMLTLAIRPCSTGWAESTSVVRVDLATLEPETLIREDPRLFVTAEWPAAEKVQLLDRDDNWWWMNATTGRVTNSTDPTSTPAPATATPKATGQPDQVRHTPSPDSRWAAVVDETVGSLVLEGSEGESVSIFSPGSTVATVEWSPDSRHLLVVRHNWEVSETSSEIQVDGPIELWLVRLVDGAVGSPELVFQSPTELLESGTLPPEQIELRQRWSPNNRYALFWHGMLSASALADGQAMWMLDTEAGQATLLADAALLNPRYQSWAPDSSALAYTAGGYRSAQVNKWLNLYDVASGQVTTVVSKTEQIPGIVAWSPQGDLVAYAAVPASETGPEWSDWMVFENPAIAGRRVYLLEPSTGEHWRLNNVDSFQDAPIWSEDGDGLYYVQREDDTLALMAADPGTGQAQAIPGTHRPAPKAVGYYGQSDWDNLLAHRPDVP